jgi:thymidylate synthase (FAD)
LAEPKLYVLARPSIDLGEISRFLSDEALEWHRTDNALAGEELVEVAGRLCYLSFSSKQSPKSNSEYIQNLIANGHESVLEHVSWSFLLTGVSRGFTHQLVRHRVGIAFSQLSQQYHDEENAGFVMPKGIELSSEASDIWKQQMNASTAAYRKIKELLSEGLKEQNPTFSTKELNRLSNSVARSVMPNATETKIAVTANARTLRHFLKMRGDIAGDYEMRYVSAAILKVVSSDAPSLFSDFALRYFEDSSPRVVHLPDENS